MAYTRPISTAANASWVRWSEYTRPNPALADATFSTIYKITYSGAIGSISVGGASIGGFIEDEVPALCLDSSGELTYYPLAAPELKKVYYNSGLLYARSSPLEGDVLITLDSFSQLIGIP